MYVLVVVVEGWCGVVWPVDICWGWGVIINIHGGSTYDAVGVGVVSIMFMPC